MSIPPQHIQHYRKHIMPGLQGMWPAIWKTEKAEETCILHWKVKEYYFIFDERGKGCLPHPSVQKIFCDFYWLVGLGRVVCVCWVFISKDHVEFSSILFTSPNAWTFWSTSSCFINFQYQHFWENRINFSHTFHGILTIIKVLNTGMLFRAHGEDRILRSCLSCTWEIHDQMRK